MQSLPCVEDGSPLLPLLNEGQLRQWSQERRKRTELDCLYAVMKATATHVVSRELHWPNINQRFTTQASIRTRHHDAREPLPARVVKEALRVTTIGSTVSHLRHQVHAQQRC